MSKKKGKDPNSPEVMRDLRALREAGYTVYIHTPYHWHIRRPNSAIVFNVWPTVQKYMQDGAHGAGRYGQKGIVYAINAIFNIVEEHHGDRLRAKQSVDELRNGGLTYIISKQKHDNEQ